MEAQCWIALMSAKKVVVAGDHLQLPPTIKSLNAKSKTLTLSNSKEATTSKGKSSLETRLFDRLLALHGSSIKRMLTINPDLSAAQIIDFIKKSTLVQEQSEIAGEFLQAEVIDEEKALRLARETVPRPRDKLSLVRGTS